MTTDFLHLADLHFSNCLPYTTVDPEKGYNKRFDAQVKCFDYACAYAVKKSIKYILIAGDVFHYHNPSSRERTVVARVLAKWARKNIHFIIMNGNHDVGGRGWSALGDLKEIGSSNIHIVCDGLIHDLSIEGYTIVIAPFVKGQTLDEVDEYCTKKNLKRDILMYHDAIIGADYGFGYKSVDGVSTTDLFALGFKYIAMGHFHKWHHWKQDGRWIIYPGSMVSRDFNEFKNQEKFCSHISMEKNNVKIKRVSYPKLNKLYKLYLDANFKPFKLFLGDKQVPSQSLTGAIVKVIYPKTPDMKHKSIDFSRISNDLYSEGASFVILEPEIKTDGIEFADLSTIGSDGSTLSALVSDYCDANGYDSKYSLDFLEGFLTNEA